MGVISALLDGKNKINSSQFSVFFVRIWLHQVAFGDDQIAEYHGLIWKKWCDLCSSQMFMTIGMFYCK